MRYARDVLSPFKERCDDQRSLVVIDFLTHAPGPPVLTELARHLGISVSRLEHVFKQGTGVSIRSFAITLRLHRAAVLLADPTIPIKHVQFECGFNHASNFSHLFRRHFSCSASVLRAQLGWRQRPRSENAIPCVCDQRVLPLVLAATRL